MSRLVLIPEDVCVNERVMVTGYGLVRFERTHTVKDCQKGAVGKASGKLVYNPALWDALRAKKRSGRQKRLIADVRKWG